MLLNKRSKIYKPRSASLGGPTLAELVPLVDSGPMLFDTGRIPAKFGRCQLWPNSPWFRVETGRSPDKLDRIWANFGRARRNVGRH